MGRFDISFKSLAGSSPVRLIGLCGRAPVDASTRVRPVERELAMTVKSVDHAFVLERGEERWLSSVPGSARNW